MFSISNISLVICLISQLEMFSVFFSDTQHLFRVDNTFSVPHSLLCSNNLLLFLCSSQTGHLLCIDILFAVCVMHNRHLLFKRLHNREIIEHALPLSLSPAKKSLGIGSFYSITMCATWFEQVTLTNVSNSLYLFDLSFSHCTYLKLSLNPSLVLGVLTTVTWPIDR